MKPYYEEDGITIYLGDCRDILPHLPKVDLVLTDPPYKNLKGGCNLVGYGVAAAINESVTVGEPWDTCLDWMGAADDISEKGLIVFCSYHFLDEIPSLTKKDKVALVTWYKRNAHPGQGATIRANTEFAWCFRGESGIKWGEIKTSMLDIPFITAGCISTGERITNSTGKAAHPTQKPLELIKTFIVTGANTILDPFMGSGTTLVAAKQLGRKATGIELEEKYCEIAVQRLRQGVLAL